jgi:hypothetical protein
MKGLHLLTFFTFRILPNCFLRDLRVLRGGYFSTGNHE